MKRSGDRPLFALTALVVVIALPFLLLCTQPQPLPVLLPTPTLAPIAATLEPTLTTVIAGPPSPHATSTYRPTPTAFVVVPSPIPPFPTATPAVLPVIIVPVTIPTPIFRPASPVPAPAQVP